MESIRLMDDLGYGTLALSKGDVVEIGTGAPAVDIRTAELWVLAGLAVDMDASGPDAAAPGPLRTQVVVHERGGMESLQSITAVNPATGDRTGPAPENPTDSDPAAGAAAGASRTAAGTVIEGSTPSATEGDGVPFPGTPLPDGFPMAARLIDGGLDSVEKVRGATDEDLVSVKYVTANHVQAIRDAVAAHDAGQAGAGKGE